MKEKVISFLCGLITGIILVAFLWQFENKSKINYGQSLAYLEVIELMANKELIAGPLLITEPNYTVSDCFFLILKRYDDEEGALIVVDSAVTGLIMNNRFVSHNIPVLKSSGSTYYNNTWVKDFIADLRPQTRNNK